MPASKPKPATVNGRKNCPGCKHWWFDRMQRGCAKDSARLTNTTSMLYSYDGVRDTCKDFE